MRYFFVLFSTEDPDDKTTLSAQNSKKSLDYYYQVRCNITHRGKAVIRDHDTVENSFNELFNITKYILDKTKYECQIIKNKYETKKVTWHSRHHWLRVFQ